MKNITAITLIVLGVFFIPSCENIQDPQDPPRSLEFVREHLSEGSATQGVKAGSFSVQGGNGALAYSLVATPGENNDNEKFALEGNRLIINVPSLDAGNYTLHIRVEDEKGKFLEESFTLTVGSRATDKALIAGILEPWRGVWYSHSSGKRLDGYRIGRWSELKTVMKDKLSLFPDFDPDSPRLHDGYAIQDDDYFVFSDDTAYGQDDNGEGGNGGFGLITRYIGIARAVNIFNGDPGVGAVIIEYLEGCYPQWAMDVLLWPLPFFGIYYRVTNPDRIQLANAVDLTALSAGRAYYTETATLQEAIDKNNVENDSKFIAWGVVIPQDREE
jgi:hypothetical protein